MDKSYPPQPFLQPEAAPIDWADQKHIIALRSAAEPNKIEHQLIDQKPEALMEWIGQRMQSGKEMLVRIVAVLSD